MQTFTTASLNRIQSRLHRKKEKRMKYQYITIEREFGSGGTKIGELLAKECKIPCYGREILETVAEKYDISVEQIEQYEEGVTNSFLYTVFVMSKAQSGDMNMLSEEGKVYLAEQAAIHRLAQDGPAVFMGHCASEALKDRKGVAKIFIHADEDFKKQRIQEDYQISTNRMDFVRKKYDKKRANYYRANTMKRWDDYHNYDIVLNSGELGIEGCVKVLKSLLV